MWAMGLTHHRFGVDNIQALANLMLGRGWLGRPGVGLLPIRGHSNVQGVGSMGVTPSMKESFAARMRELYGIEPGPVEGKDTYACMAAAQRGEMDAAFLLGGNLLGANPDRAWSEQALGRIPFTLTLSTKLNTGHALRRGGTRIVLPVLARDEEPQRTTQESMFNFVRMSDGGEAELRGGDAVGAELRSEVQVIASLARRILPPDRFDWASLEEHASLREAVSSTVPGYGALRELDEGGAEFQIGGRSFHRPRFATEDGRANCRVTPVPHWKPAAGKFRLMTLRSEGQFNSVVYEEEDLYRGGAPRDALLISRADLTQLGLPGGARVIVRSECGEMSARLHLADLPAGNLAMYYPEANLLVPRRLDARSKTPAFKSVEVSVEAVPMRSGERGEPGTQLPARD
jgi:molybdopterin-dependent oxidoreductase alpha subunit